MAAATSAKRRVWSTPLRLINRTRWSFLQAMIRQPSAFSSNTQPSR
jgi:hypothetical protein